MRKNEECLVNHILEQKCQVGCTEHLFCERNIELAMKIYYVKIGTFVASNKYFGEKDRLHQSFPLSAFFLVMQNGTLMTSNEKFANPNDRPPLHRNPINRVHLIG